MDTKYEQVIEDELKSLNAEFASNLYSINYSKDKFIEYGNVHAAETKGNKLQTNITIYGFGSKEELHNMMKNSIATGKLIPVKEADYEKYLVNHEFAHAITAYNLPKSARDKIDALHTDYIVKTSKLEQSIKSKNLEFLSNPTAKITLEVKKATKELSLIQVSKYAKVNTDEFMAECFAYKRLVGNDNEYANKVYDIIKQNNKASKFK